MRHSNFVAGLCLYLLAGLFAVNSYADEVTIIDTDGIYKGEVLNDVKQGQGTFTYTDGTKYVGEWKNDKKHGQGIYTWSDGSKYDGEWKDGDPWNGADYDEEGNVTATFSDGVWTVK